MSIPCFVILRYCLKFCRECLKRAISIYLLLHVVLYFSFKYYCNIYLESLVSVNPRMQLLETLEVNVSKIKRRDLQNFICLPNSSFMFIFSRRFRRKSRLLQSTLTVASFFSSVQRVTSTFCALRQLMHIY